MRSPSATVGAALVAAVAAGAVLAPFLTPYPASGDPPGGITERLERRLAPPSAAHPLGTDASGRDVLARTLWGGRISLAVGLAARLAAVVVGTAIGVAAAWRGGWTDRILTTLVEWVLAFPALLLAIAIGVALGPGLATIAVAIVVVSWTDVAILARAVVAEVKTRPFVEAARALGAGPAAILRRHVLPHLAPYLVVSFTLGVATAVMIEASLTFLGLGIEAGASPVARMLGLGETASSGAVPSWGQMIYAAKDHVATAPLAVFAPCAVLAATVLGWNLLGDGLRDALDVRDR
jgi:peptide/nickel transport system permease protein